MSSGLPDLDSPSAFVRATGLRLDHMAPDRVTGRVELGRDHHTPWGVVHGGVYTTVIETVASIGASLAARDRGRFAVGVNNTTDFLRPLVEGPVDVVAEPIMQGSTQQLWAVTIARPDGKLVARGQVRLQNVPLPG